jgi:hypothetical protein
VVKIESFGGEKLIVRCRHFGKVNVVNDVCGGTRLGEILFYLL